MALSIDQRSAWWAYGLSATMLMSPFRKDSPHHRFFTAGAKGLDIVSLLDSIER